MPEHPRTDAPFGHVLSALVTPFRADGSLDTDAVAGLAEHLVAHGHDGLVVNGTTGESPTTSDVEKDAVVRAVVEAVGDRVPVVAGVGTNDTRHTVELAGRAERAGAAGLLVVTPYYNKPPQAGLVRHFREVADATGLPVMLYDIPGRTGVPIATDTLLRLAEHDRIVAVKDAKGDLLAGSRVMASSGLAYYSGDDGLNLPWLALGAAGIVSVVAHVAGDAYAAMDRAVRAGDLPAARALHARLLPAVFAIMSPRSQGVITTKAALAALGRIPTRTTRPPLVDATDEETAEVLSALTEAGLR